jgi:hypothetical protein
LAEVQWVLLEILLDVLGKGVLLWSHMFAVVESVQCVVIELRDRPPLVVGEAYWAVRV